MPGAKDQHDQEDFTKSVIMKNGHQGRSKSRLK
jgi:hypothetical protein